MRIRNPGIIADLEKIMTENIAGINVELLRWIRKSQYKIADELKLSGNKVYIDTVERILKDNDYSV